MQQGCKPETSGSTREKWASTRVMWVSTLVTSESTRVTWENRQASPAMPGVGRMRRVSIPVMSMWVSKLVTSVSRRGMWVSRRGMWVSTRVMSANMQVMSVSRPVTLDCTPEIVPMGCMPVKLASKQEMSGSRIAPSLASTKAMRVNIVAILVSTRVMWVSRRVM